MPFEIPPLRQPGAPRAERRWRELRVCEYCGRAFAPAGAEVRCPECLARWSRPMPRGVSAAEMLAFDAECSDQERRKHRRRARKGIAPKMVSEDGVRLAYCHGCGRLFRAAAPQSRFCPGCKKARRLAQVREAYRRWHARKTGKEAK